MLCFTLSRCAGTNCRTVKHRRRIHDVTTFAVRLTMAKSAGGRDNSTYEASTIAPSFFLRAAPVSTSPTICGVLHVEVSRGTVTQIIICCYWSLTRYGNAGK